MTRLTPAPDAAPADWIVAALVDLAETACSLVPAGFEAYVRVFHPALLNERPVTWAQIAAGCGKSLRPATWLADLIGERFRRGTYPQPGIYDRPPEEGSLPGEVLIALLPVLERHTSTRALCWFASWEGWGDIRPDVADAPRFEVPCREYRLLSGPLGAADEGMEVSGYQSASIWWPTDRAWCVATEIDFDTTYIGCSEACCADILALPDVEALRVEPTAPLRETAV